MEIANNAREYILGYTTPESEIGSILTGVVGKYSPDIYLYEKDLINALHEFHATDVQAYQVSIMTKVTGFRELLERNSSVQQLDLERYLQNALSETGFSREKVMELTAAIAHSASIAVEIMSTAQFVSVVEEPVPYVIPGSVYQTEMHYFNKLYQEGRLGYMSEADIRNLAVLADAGIARAKAYLGWVYLCKGKDDGWQEERDIAVSLLEDAYDSGDSCAAAFLGDYYYDRGDSESWSKAYEYYTGYGAVVCNGKQRKRISGILNHKLFNEKLLKLSLILPILLLVLVISPGIAVGLAARILGVLFILISVTLYTVSVLHFRVRPYDEYYWLPEGLFVLCVLYLACRIIF